MALGVRAVAVVGAKDLEPVAREQANVTKSSKRKFSAMKRVMGSLPLNWRPKDWLAWMEILGMTHPKHVVNVSGGDGSLEIACVAFGVACTTITWNPNHAKYISAVVDRGILSKLMLNPKFKHLYASGDAKKIESLFPVRVAKVVDDSDDSSSEWSLG